MSFDPPWGSSWNTCQDKVGFYRKTSLNISERPEPTVPVKKVNPQARLEELRHLRVMAHPDRGGTHEQFIAVNAEYERLRDMLRA